MSSRTTDDIHGLRFGGSRNLIRGAFVVVALLVGLALWAAFFRPGQSAPSANPEEAAAGSAFASAVRPAVLLSALNAVRAEHGLPPLGLSAALSRAARQHSVEMGRRGYFAHRSANGTVFWRRIRRFYSHRGFQKWEVGENLAWEPAPMPPAGVVADWLASPEHRANVLGRHWRDVGIASALVPHAPGVFHGEDAAIVTVDFGVRRG